MRALHRKVWRDLWRMKGQVFAITLVIVSGVATFIMFITTMHSLDRTRNSFYSDYNFADVFVNLKRAPESLKEAMHVVACLGGEFRPCFPHFLNNGVRFH